MMSSWAIVALVAIVIWGWVERAKVRAGIVTDDEGRQTAIPRDDGRASAELEVARRELEDLRERVKVLERITTDAHTGEARETARISAEIEALRATPAAKEE